MMTLNEVAASLNDRIGTLEAQIRAIKDEPFDEYYFGQQHVYELEVRYLTALRDKILGE